MIVLGIESTAHTLGIGVVEDGEILSNVFHTFKPEKGKGLLPRDVADHHVNVFPLVLKESLKKAGVSIKDIDLIAFSQGPGIGAPLKISLVAAKYLGLKYNIPIIGVNHCFAHLKISEHLTGLKNPLYVYTSGGNTQIIVEKDGFHILGETLDIGIGNLFDTFLRDVGLEGHGSILEKLARRGLYIPLPYSVKGLDLVFSGLLTEASKKLKTNKIEDVAYSLMMTSFSMVVEVAERALLLEDKDSLIVCGGVAQNKTFQKMLKIMCEENEVKFGVAPNEFNRDNGAMIAYAGYIEYKKKGTKPIKEWHSIQNYRIDMVR